MFRAGVVRSFWVVICGTSLAFAQDPPPLEGPATEPDPRKVTAPQSGAATPPPALNPSSSAPAAPSPVRPMLIIPGVTVPSQHSGAATRPKIPQPPRPSASTKPGPSTNGPTAGPPNRNSPFRPYATPPPPSAPDAVLRDPIPLTLEPLDDDPAPKQRQEATPSQRRMRDRASASTPVEVETERAPASQRPAPSRLPGLLGRILGQPPTTTARDASRTDDLTTRTRTKAKTKSEPETDAVVKRRIEQQIRATLGDKVQGVEVRVSGRNVLIVARATRFWQKRGVYRSLESLPALAGYRARIDLDN